MPDDRKQVGKRSANEKLVTRFGEHDKLVGLEGAYRKLEVTLRSPMMKRTYLRFFDRLQRDLNVVSVVGRVTNLDLGKLEQIEEALSGRMKSIREDIEKETARAQTLIRKQGLDLSKLEFLEPMTVAAKVTSPISRLFLDLLPAGDDLIACLDLLVIEAVVMQSTAERQKAALRNRLRDVVKLVRRSAIGIHELAPDRAKQTEADLDEDAAAEEEVHAEAGDAPKEEGVPAPEGAPAG